MRPYIPPPTPDQMAMEFSKWVARLFRVDVRISIDNKRGDVFNIHVDGVGQ